ncbi:MAG: ABC transporter permease [Candidatus Angelobacter sp. Gp1-AA117]|nr:MAG: ABC transporter permease [Candidatus Angelobacter sp. Gp1-AA117]
MNTLSNPALQVSRDTPAIPATRLMYWSVQRELWENRSIYIAPVAAAVVFLIGFIISLVRQRHRQTAWPVDQMQLHHLLSTPYEFAAGLIMGTAFIVGVFYSMDALYGERRDRSILFWKSLPVSDLAAVLAKAAVPLLVLPLLSFVITIVTQFIMVLLSAGVLLGSGPGLGAIWREAAFFHVSVTLFYHLLTVHGLWYAPIYGWLLLVSAWAPRAPFIWAFLPPFVIFVVEKIAFNTSHFIDMLVRRLTGPESSVSMTPGSAPMDPLAKLIPANFFSEPGLWVGLAIAAAFLAAAVRLRRYRGPI